MNERYRISRSFGGGYTVRQSDVIEEAAYGAAGLMGSLIGASIGGIATLARQSRDRALAEWIGRLDVLTQEEAFDDLLREASLFLRKYRQEPYGYSFRAIALASRQQYAEALSDANNAAQLGLDPLEAAYLRILIYHRQGNAGHLLQEWTRLAADGATRRDALLGRAQVLADIGDFDQALADMNQAISLSPDASGYFVRAEIHRAQGHLETAVEDYTRAIRLDQDDAKLLARRAETYEELGKLDAAAVDRDAEQRLRVSSPSAKRAHTNNELIATRPAAICTRASLGTKVREWPAGTRFEIVGPDWENWRQVRDPSGLSGWVPRKVFRPTGG